MKIWPFKIIISAARGIIWLIITTSVTPCVFCQRGRIDDLKKEIVTAKADSTRIFLYEELGQNYRDINKIDSSILSYQQALVLNRKIKYSPLRQSWNMGAIDYMLFETGKYTESLQYAYQQLSLSEKLIDTSQQGSAHLIFGHDYRQLEYFRESLNHYFKAKEFFKIYWLSRNKPEDNAYTEQCIAEVYLKMNKLDSALFFTNMAYHSAEELGNGRVMLYSTRILGDIYLLRGEDQKAMEYYRRYIPDYVKYKETNRDLGFVLNSMAKIFQNKGQTDSANIYARRALENAKRYQDQENIYAAATLLYQFFNDAKSKDRSLIDSLHNKSEAYRYFKIAVAARDSMAGVEKLKQIEVLSFGEQVREKQQAATDSKEATRLRLIIIVSAVIFFSVAALLWYRIRQLRLKYRAIMEQKEVEKLKTKYEKNLIELEAKALRAQMNPHFIFNCLNSIKSLIQQHDEEKSVRYLTTFSKLIRNLFNSADKKEINLYDELETCKLYLQLESMRFDAKFSFAVNVDENIDLKSVQVPALIIQPFIENAIWHGIVPRNTGGKVLLNVKRMADVIEVAIDDDGIGREAAEQNKSLSGLAHQSKGVSLTQSRLELNNLLQQRQAALEIIDKHDEYGLATGTTVIIKLKEERS